MNFGEMMFRRGVEAPRKQNLPMERLVVGEVKVIDLVKMLTMAMFKVAVKVRLITKVMRKLMEQKTLMAEAVNLSALSPFKVIRSVRFVDSLRTRIICNLSRGFLSF